MTPPVDREGGFIVIHRRVRSSRLYRSLTAEQKGVFLTLLLLANWREDAIFRSGNWHKVARGELAHTEETIADEAGCSRKVVRTTLAKMMADDTSAGGRGPFIKTRWTGPASGLGLRILIICRYSEYQDVNDNVGPDLGTHRARVGPGLGPGGAPREQVQPEEQDQPEQQEAFAGAGAPPAVQKARKQRKPSAQERIGRALNDARVRAHPELEEWPVESKRFIQVVNAAFADGKPIRCAYERLGSATFFRAFELYLEEPYWRDHGGWPLRGFLADGKWQEYLDAAKDAAPAAPPAVTPDSYWQQELAALTPEEREEAIRARAEHMKGGARA
jgi:hypothetical protein